MLKISDKTKKKFTDSYKKLRNETYDRSAVEMKLRKCFSSVADGEK